MATYPFYVGAPLLFSPGAMSFPPCLSNEVMRMMVGVLVQRQSLLLASALAPPPSPPSRPNSRPEWLLGEEEKEEEEEEVVLVTRWSVVESSSPRVAAEGELLLEL